MNAHQTIDQFLEWMRGEVEHAAGRERQSKASTLRYYEHQLERLRALIPGHLDASEIKAYHLDRVRHSWHCCQAAKRVFRWASRTERIATCPLAGMSLPPLGERERVLTADEFEAIIRCCEPYHQQFIWVMLRTGARPVELRELEWEHVDFERRILTVRHYKGKRRRSRQSRRATRQIPMDLDVREVLAKRKADRDRIADPPAIVFTGRYGQPLTCNAVCQNFRRACRRAGIDQSGERAVSYTLRHTAATTLTADEINQKLLAEVLGHARISTTERYQHLDSSHTVAAIDRAREVAKSRGNSLMLVGLPGGAQRQPGLFDGLG